MKQKPVLCPSYRCEEGTILLGIVQTDGRVAFASDRILVDGDFVRVARQGRSPEKRFRFSGPCVERACKQWKGGQCSVVHTVIEAVGRRPEPAVLPACSIRSQCRWYLQLGGEACAVCPEVVTDIMVPEEAASGPVR